jgi:hypothetical protein
VAMTFPAEGVVLKLSWGVVGWFHFTDFLYLSFKVMTLCKIHNPSVGLLMNRMLIVDLQNMVTRK